ncbi:hypothetical protein [Bradyrhizobium sp. B117]|uniref:hypothetical protein n=1 Tax=Bradyrhizobium sp. B117 TaxID=3140246 RepID=UPI003183728F
MSGTANQASLGADIDAEKFAGSKTPMRERAFAGAYLTAVDVAMICWLYVITRAALAAISWMVFG